MINSINKIYGIGKYDQYDGVVPVTKNQVFFGFNGSGKSTLSDIFYSLSDEEHSKKLLERKTLQRDDGTISNDPEIILGTDTNDLIFRDGSWNSRQNIFVFNDQYIDDYVTLRGNHDIDQEQLILGKEGNRINRQKLAYENDFKVCLQNINEVISNNKEICNNLGVGKNKISVNNWNKRITNIAKLSLYTESQKKIVEKNLEGHKIYNKHLQRLNLWLENLVKHARFLEKNAFATSKGIVELFKNVPTVSNKEIADHITHYMACTDINWLVAGMNNRADAEHCPFCGQELKDKKITKLSKQLERFIKGRQKQKADKISNAMSRLAPYFDVNLIETLFQSINEIYSENCNAKYLHSKTSKLLLELQTTETIEQEDLYRLSVEIQKKMKNPYVTIVLDERDKAVVKRILVVLQKYGKLVDLLKDEIQKQIVKIEKSKEFEKQMSLYIASFGENADNFKDMINVAKKMITLADKISKCQKEIDHLAETQRISGINSILEELNVNYQVHTEEGKFFVKITGFVPAEYEKGNKILCSEGERRILAFAYFMQELLSVENDKIIVIDDPISSLDVNRKSVVAYKIMQLMEDVNNQVIVLSHDISFVEKIKALENSNLQKPTYIEIKKRKENPFVTLDIMEYLATDKQVYERIIKDGINAVNEQNRIIAFMAMRPYTYVCTKSEGRASSYAEIEYNSTYFAHSIYSTSKRISYKEEQYNCEGLRNYCEMVKNVTGLDLEKESLVPDDYVFHGLNFDKAWDIFSSIPEDSIHYLRKKALVFRVLLETTLFMLLTKNKFDPEHISKPYNNAVKGQVGEKKEICKKIKKMYDLSKKYHHGAEEGSTLGLSALNPDEMIYFTKEITSIHDWIVANPDKTNPNNTSYVL